MKTHPPMHALIVWEVGDGGRERAVSRVWMKEGTIELIAYELHPGR